MVDISGFTEFYGRCRWIYGDGWVRYLSRQGINDALSNSENLTPQPPSLQGKGEPEILLPSPLRGGVGGGVKLVIENGASYQI